MLKRDEHIHDRVKSELTAEKKTVQLLQEELMSTGLLIGEVLFSCLRYKLI